MRKDKDVVWLIYIDDNRAGKYWLHDLIASDSDLHPVFVSVYKLAMKMPDCDTALGWHKKLMDIGYAPHIISRKDW